MNTQRNEENLEEIEYIDYEETEYIVAEKILQKRVTHEGKLEYFLKWKNLPDSDNVWIPVEVLGSPELGSPELINAYEDSLKCEIPDKKRKFGDTENSSIEYRIQKKACMSAEKKTENVKEKDYPVEKIQNKRITGEDRFEHLISNSDKSVEDLSCPELDKDCEDSFKCESSDQKRKLNDSENFSAGSVLKKKAYVDKSNDVQMHIDLLPEEILIKILQNVPQNELGRIARISKKWHELTKSPILWKKVDVQFRWRHGSQNKIAAIFSENLPSCVTHLKIDFLFLDNLEWTEHLKFVEFCKRLANKCPSLKTLIMYGTRFSVNLQSVIDLCRTYLQNLEVLFLYYPYFTKYSVKGKYNDFSKIKILDFFCPFGMDRSTKLRFSRMTSLKKMSSVHTVASNNWFHTDISFLENLEVLNLQWSETEPRVFQTLQNHALKLTELYLCGANLKDSDFRFNTSVFPQLKTICLSGCHKVTCEGIISLIRSCKSLQNVYVSRTVAESYAMHHFVFADISKLGIVRNIELCQHFIKDYLNGE